MDDAEPMGGVERPGDARFQDQNFRKRKSAACQLARQRNAVDEFHREIGPLNVGIDGKDVVANDRFVLQRVQRGGLAPEQRHGVRVSGHLGPQHLDRDGIVGLDVEALVDLAHPAFADQPLDFVDAVQANAGAQRSSRRRLKNSALFHLRSPPGPRAAAAGAKHTPYRMWDKSMFAPLVNLNSV